MTLYSIDVASMNDSECYNAITQRMNTPSAKIIFAHMYIAHKSHIVYRMELKYHKYVFRFTYKYTVSDLMLLNPSESMLKLYYRDNK